MMRQPTLEETFSAIIVAAVYWVITSFVGSFDTKLANLETRMREYHDKDISTRSEARIAREAVYGARLTRIEERLDEIPKPKK